MYEDINNIRISKAEINFENNTVTIIFVDRLLDNVCTLIVMPSINKRTGIWHMYGARTEIKKSKNIYITNTAETRLKFLGKSIADQLIFEIDHIGAL